MDAAVLVASFSVNMGETGSGSTPGAGRTKEPIWDEAADVVAGVVAYAGEATALVFVVEKDEIEVVAGVDLTGRDGEENEDVLEEHGDW